MMKRQAIMVLRLALLLGALGVHSQAHSTDHMVIKVPFLFTVGNTTLPPGEYRVRRVSQSSLMIQSTSKPRAAAVFSAVGMVQGSRQVSSAKLVFRAYDGEHFLSQVWMPGHNAGRAVPVTQAESMYVREVAKSHAATPQTVAVVAGQ